MTDMIDNPLIEEMVVKYRELKSGQSKTMLRGLVSAQEHLLKYIESRGLGIDKSSGKSMLDFLKATEICTEDFFRQFGTYLVEHASKGNGQLLLSGTAIQYLSAIKEWASKNEKFRDSDLFSMKSLDRWYFGNQGLRVAVEKAINR